MFVISRRRSVGFCWFYCVAHWIRVRPVVSKCRPRGGVRVKCLSQRKTESQPHSWAALVRWLLCKLCDLRPLGKLRILVRLPAFVGFPTRLLCGRASNGSCGGARATPPCEGVAQGRLRGQAGRGDWRLRQSYARPSSPRECQRSIVRFSVCALHALCVCVCV